MVTVLKHHGIKGMHWGVRRYQNPDGTLTDAGRKKYFNSNGVLTKSGRKATKKEFDSFRKEYHKLRNVVEKDEKYTSLKEKDKKIYKDIVKYQSNNKISKYDKPNKELSNMKKEYSNNKIELEKHTKRLVENNLSKKSYNKPMSELVSQSTYSTKRGEGYVKFLLNDDLYKNRLI